MEQAQPLATMTLTTGEQRNLFAGDRFALLAVDSSATAGERPGWYWTIRCADGAEGELVLPTCNAALGGCYLNWRAVAIVRMAEGWMSLAAGRDLDGRARIEVIGEPTWFTE